MNQNKVVAIVNTHAEAEDALNMLINNGFEVNTLSIIGKGYHSEEHATGFYNTIDRVKKWGKSGAVWGGVWGALVGSGMFLVPTVGALVVAGPFVTTLVGAIEGAAVTGGLTAFGGALASIGIPKDSIVEYETAIKTDKYLVLLDVDQAELDKATNILADHNVNTH